MSRVNRNRWIVLMVGAALLPADTVMAEDNDAETTVAAVPAPRQQVTVAGAGAFTIPRYPGSSSVEVKAFPVVDAEFWNRLFIHTGDGVGLYLWHAPAWNAGISLDADPLHRYEKDAERLRGLGNVDQTERVNFLVAHYTSCSEIKLKLSADVGGQGHGNIADLEMARSRELLPGLRLRAAVGWTWTDAQYMRTFFGVNTRQSFQSGLPVFSPEAGVSSVRGVLAAQYAVTEHWLIGGLASVTRLLGDAADSPITEKHAQLGGGVFFTYTWKSGQP